MKLWICLCVVLPCLVLLAHGPSLVVRGQEDELEDEMVDVEGEDTGVVDEGEPQEEEPGDKGPKGSPDAETTLLFTKPAAPQGQALDLPAGTLVEFLVGFTNKGGQDFVLETLDASFRYPMDFTFYIQNFSTLAYEKTVKPKQLATLAYSFIPSESFAGRPFGLSINLRYRDLSGNQFYEGVYNETVNIVELDEGLDGETFFLYVLLGAAGVLLLVVGQQFLYSMGRKRVMAGISSASKKQIETGTSANHNDVDYEWLPKETLQSLNKSPRVRTPKTSPKVRKTRSAGRDD